MAPKILPTTVVGSYPQPDWLVNREMLSKVVPRTRMKEIWRVAEPFLEQAQDDATVIAIRDMERAGIDIITDGEMRRESYSNRFATALEGIDLDRPGQVQTRSGAMTAVPRVVGKLTPQPPCRAARHGVPAPQHRPSRQDHAAGAVHDGAAGQERVLSRRRRDGHGLRGRGEPGGARPAEGGRRRDPARRAVGAQQSRGGEALWGQGDQSCARRHRRPDRRAHLLRLRCGGAGRFQAAWLRLPARARRQRRRADFDRSRAAQDRSRRAARSCRQEGHARRPGPRRTAPSRPPTRSPSGSAAGSNTWRRRS